MKNRIQKLLINGFKPSEIANTVGCAPGYVTQLLKDEDFKASVEAGMAEISAVRTEEEHLDKRYESFELRLINAAETALPEASLGEITRALETIHKRDLIKHQKKNPAAPTGTVNINVVSLQLPAHALPGASRPQVTVNQNKEIIAIDGKALAPMSSDAVKNLFAARQLLSNQQVVDAAIIQEM